jgi:hypothetical protein
MICFVQGPEYYAANDGCWRTVALVMRRFWRLRRDGYVRNEIALLPNLSDPPKKLKAWQHKKHALYSI